MKYRSRRCLRRWRRAEGEGLWATLCKSASHGCIVCSLLVVLTAATALPRGPIRQPELGGPASGLERPTAPALTAPKARIPVLPLKEGPGQAAAPVRTNATTSDFEVAWTDSCDTPPAAAETALTYAAGIWAALLSSPVPIQVSACWTSTPLCGGIACGDTTTRVRNSAGALLVDTHYPIALANALAGADQDPARRDITLHFDAGVDWSFATDGPPTGSIDFVSVALHEMAHGLGFTGNMYESYNIGYCGDGPFGYLYPCPTPYDWFVIDGGGVQLLEYLGPDPRDLGAKLKSDAQFGGPNATASNSGAPVKLHTPSVWQQGTSLSHLDQDAFGSAENGLMTPIYGGALRSPGPVALAMLQDMGWPRSDGVPFITTGGPLAIGVDQDASFDGVLDWASYAGQPVSYSWTATGQQDISHSGLGITDSVTLNWGTAGVKTVTVMAGGGGASASATRSALVIDVAATGLAQGEPDTSYTFDATVTPGAAGFPVAYTWEATGLQTITHSGQGAADAVTFSWPTAGAKTVKVSAALGGATVHDVHTIHIGDVVWNSFVFLPVLQLP